MPRAPFHILFLLLITWLSLPAAAQNRGLGDTAPPPQAFFTWSIINKCRSTVHLAVHYVSVRDGRNVTEGWKHLRPNRTLVLEVKREWVGFVAYLESGPAERTYFPLRPDTRKFRIDHERDFIYRGEGLRQDSSEESYSWISVAEENSLTLTC